MATYSDVLTLAAWNAAAEGRGNVKLVWGGYTGDGTYGESHPTKLTFDGTPLWVKIRTFTLNENIYDMEGIWGQSSMRFSTSSSNNCSWTENSLSWYNPSGYASYQLNQSGVVYYYLALLGV